MGLAGRSRLVRRVRVGVAEALELGLVHGVQDGLVDGRELGALVREGPVEVLHVQRMLLRAGNTDLLKQKRTELE